MTATYSYRAARTPTSLARFSNGRCSARLEMRGETLEQAIKVGPRWFPRVCGENVAPSNGVGFSTRNEAVADAKLFRQRSRNYAAKITAEQADAALTRAKGEQS